MGFLMNQVNCLWLTNSVTLPSFVSCLGQVSLAGDPLGEADCLSTKAFHSQSAATSGACVCCVQVPTNEILQIWLREMPRERGEAAVAVERRGHAASLWLGACSCLSGLLNSTSQSLCAFRALCLNVLLAEQVLSCLVSASRI